MNYKFVLILLILFLNSCMPIENAKLSKKKVIIESFSNKGFALVYKDILFQKKIINKKN